MNIDEALTMQQRLKRKTAMRKSKGKIKRGKDLASRKRASPEKIKKRALAQARTLLLKKLTKGKSKDELSYAQREQLEKKLEKKKGAIARIAKKLIPKVRDQEKKKFAAKNKKDD